MCIYTYIHIDIFTCIYIDLHICIYTYIHIDIFTYLHIYISTYIHIYISCICAYIHTYVHTYIHTYIQTYIQTYIHTYIHTYCICVYLNSTSWLLCTYDSWHIQVVGRMGHGTWPLLLGNFRVFSAQEQGRQNNGSSTNSVFSVSRLTQHDVMLVFFHNKWSL